GWVARGGLLHAQFGAALRRNHVRVPGRIPYHLDVGSGHTRQVLDALPGIHGDGLAHTASRGGQRHAHLDAALAARQGLDTEIVDQAEIDDVHRDLWVVHVLQHRPDGIVADRAAARGGRSTRRGSLQTERVGIGAGDTEEATQAGYLHRVAPTQRL